MTESVYTTLGYFIDSTYPVRRLTRRLYRDATINDSIRALLFQGYPATSLAPLVQLGLSSFRPSAEFGSNFNRPGNFHVGRFSFRQ
jgi:hypothetical protein